MKFLDEAKLKVFAGDGGNGVVSFRREARVSMGGPDGGDGGNGGSIYFVGDPGLNTLYSLKMNINIRGNKGENGRAKNQFGAAGKDIFIKVPEGTLVFNDNRLICDVIDRKNYLIAQGGKGGRGNNKFKSSRNQAPRLSENGTKGEVLELQLTLKVLADVGFVGKPSAGKSTLLSKVSNAKPKIADYDFTTLDPQLGFVHTGVNSFVVADLPGLIKGASLGKGLGLEFLKHIERCRVIAHIIDFGAEQKSPVEDYKQINNELNLYKINLDKRKQVVIANKKDLQHFDEHLKVFKEVFPNIKIVEISAVMEKGLEPLKAILYEAFVNSKAIEYDIKIKDEVTIKLEDDIIIENPYEGLYEIRGAAVKRIYERIPLNTFDNIQRFNRMMRNIGLWKELRRRNIQNGDMVRIIGFEMEWDEDNDEL
ncbi:GTPase ObgE [Candidatus Mycoplasma mahonii]|uniref:GTPase ObgE n=1 Tax=Candidatus Mycoplasma mahonii TaxID=3004105 RepID=UPI0026EAEE40|nr:GTPase ObgE [Candidatus Mycoplasma mahonii]WKX02323.1 GTPase ObgE [Candidatus Mycoplasma mahonii]